MADPNCEPDSVSYTDDLVADPNYEPDSVSYTVQGSHSNSKMKFPDFSLTMFQTIPWPDADTITSFM